MGVPAFFRWLSRKYPSVIVPCIEQKAVNVDGVDIVINSADPNPNGVEFDNLYLDMNGIIHPCTHPEDRPAPKDEEEMMQAIFECIDRLFRIVRPRKLLYMAIDGVAPRAKMNQQRSRRFRASKETMEKITEIQKIRSKLSSEGVALPPEKPTEEHFDSNCITPGTPFMARLSACLHYYIHDRLNTDPGWRNIKVILSDANVPGEGEHKIMDFIRRQRAQPDHDPNTQHVLCGADADLIMLGLATHEPNFTIIREEFKPNKPKPCEICGQLGHTMQQCTGAEANKNDQENAFGSECQYIFVRLNVLREYLERELYMPDLPFKYDFERVVDDWVFMCFFVGNDFLPHLPSLEIREGAIDRLVNLYKKAVYKTGGFLTDSGDVNLDRVQLIMSELGEVENEIFKKRQENELAFKQREKAKQQGLNSGRNYSPKWIPVGQFGPTPLGKTPKPVQNARYEAYQMRVQGDNYNSNAAVRALKGANANSALESMLTREGPPKRKADDLSDSSSSDDEIHDEVRLWEDGFKDRYYESKFDVSSDNLAFRNNVALQYVRGLCWVLRYYYQGCASWKWYFPYHYAPFASDFINIAGLSTEFEKGTNPFRPLEQLMGVFPAASSKHVPEPWAKLMSDPRSPIIDFYPEDFKIDLNGKKFAWQGVALLPFVDEKRLFKALEPYYAFLTEAEKKRNIRGNDRLYVGLGNNGYDFVKGLYSNRGQEFETEISMEGMRGTILAADDCVSEGATMSSPINTLPVRNNKVYCVKFKDPEYGSSFIFPARKLKGARDPARVLKPQDFEQMNRGHHQWKPQIGFTPATQVASLGEAGRRMIGHHTNSNNRHNSNRPGYAYSCIPPPQSNMSPHHGGQQQQRHNHHQPQRHNQQQQQQQQQAGYRSVSYGYSSAGSNRPNAAARPTGAPGAAGGAGGGRQAAAAGLAPGAGPWAAGYGQPPPNYRRYADQEPQRGVQYNHYQQQPPARNQGNYQNSQYNSYHHQRGYSTSQHSPPSHQSHHGSHYGNSSHHRGGNGGRNPGSGGGSSGGGGGGGGGGGSGGNRASWQRMY